MADAQYKVGQTVRTNEGREGLVRYIGELHIAPGEWLGLELPDASGKNDGSVKGERYFTCKPGHGIFVREGAIVAVVKEPVAKLITKPSLKPNGTATASIAASKPRPSGGIGPELARKRQSLMSNGSTSATGSRLSMRSPTKSPNKLASTTVSSATSTPRTGTPLAANRTSDPATKSRLSVSGRPSLGPSGSGTRPTQTARPSLAGPGNLKSSVGSRPSIGPGRPAGVLNRTAQHTRSRSQQEGPATKDPSKSEHDGSVNGVASPKIEEEEEEEQDHDDNQEIPSTEETPDPAIETRDTETNLEQEAQSPVTNSNPARNIGTSRTGSIGNVESRVANQREIEQLKAKIRTLEKKRQDDRDKLKEVETLQNDKDRFEGIIQALQKKLRSNQQELVEVRSKCEEAEARANAIPQQSGEHESELELATLDKEMAEERAETYQLELEALKSKHEELELEVEILREENTELASTMSPEEKANAGWLQMERERERLRDALLRLRDMSQENESDMKAQIEELREQLDEAEKTAGLYSEASEKLTRTEETNKHLMGQLEAVESNDEVVEAMELQREQQLNTIEQLRSQIQDLEEHIQVTDELEFFHVDEEKRLHAQLDENEALLSESHRRILEQDRVVEDLEYTLTKFRDVVQGLQSDIDELRRSRDISELQANEMSSKSRAMMDLNLRLQNNAAKTQTKIIDTELNKVRADLTSKHLDIVSHFTMENFESEKKPILALLCFGRIRSQANLVGKMLGERLRERSHLSSGDEVFRTFETMEGIEWISGMCQRFERFMQSCSTHEFATLSSALPELEPVERTISVWIEALRRDELARNDPEHLKRMREIILDLSEKLITDSTETKATEIIVQASMVENYSESLTSQLNVITRMVQSKLGSPRAEDEESLVFDKRMDQLVTKARTIKYLSGKVVQHLNDLRDSSVCLGETSWVLFEDAEHATEALSKDVRTMGLAITEDLSKLDLENSASYTTIPNIMMLALQDSLQSNGSAGDDPFTYLSTRLNSLQYLVDDLQTKSSDINNTIEFESNPSPWTVRAKEIKNAKFISPQVQEELTRLERRNLEYGTKIAERERTIEEMGMRVEIAEKRFKESREKDNKDKALQEDLDRLQSEKRVAEQAIASLRDELTTALQAAETAQADLEAVRSTTTGDALATAGAAANLGITGAAIDEGLAKQLDLEAKLLQAEISTLQAAVRYLREENKSLRTPISEVLIASAKQSWLDPSIIHNRRTQPSSSTQTKRTNLEREAVDIWSGLIDVANTLKPIRLSSPSTSKERPAPQRQEQAAGPTRQSLSRTPRHTALRQREELERWEALRDDFLAHARVSTRTRGSRGLPRTNAGQTGVPRDDGSNLVPSTIGTGVMVKGKEGQNGVAVGGHVGVKVVES